MNKKLYTLLGLLVILALVLSACQNTQATTEATEQTYLPGIGEQTQAPEVKQEATAASEDTPVPTRIPVGENTLILATTTSTQDSGLLDYLLPMFKDETGIEVQVIAVGTGQAIALGKDGNADVLLVHARSQEDAFMESGDGVRREDVMYNDFVIVGPGSDPAGIKGITTAVDAFKKLAETQSPFISRGDKSGTNTKELGIWKKAEIEPAGDWYINAGQGMGEVLTMANEQQAYTLSDRATYLARTKEGLDLVVLVEGDKDLLNPYGVIAVNSEKNPAIKGDLANQFIDWIISVPVQEKIAEFGKADFGQSLFIPDSQPWRDAQSAVPASTP
jgi:tungstate transport system substrate-binding protein